MFRYESENPDELELFEGDIITVLNKDVPENVGWWEGEVNGEVGMFPSNFVQLLPAEEEDTSVKDKAPVAPAAAKKGVPVLPHNLDKFKKSPSKYSCLQRH
ncbi:SH3-domain kinase binding protein 1 [Porites harrisoni]